MRNSAAALSILLVAGLAPVVTGPAAQAATQTVQAPCRYKMKLKPKYAEAPVYSDKDAPRSWSWLKKGRTIQVGCVVRQNGTKRPVPTRGTSYSECGATLGYSYYFFKWHPNNANERLVYIATRCVTKA